MKELSKPSNTVLALAKRASSSGKARLNPASTAATPAASGGCTYPAGIVKLLGFDRAVEGIWHIWIGIAHILFLLSLLLLAPLSSAPRSVVSWEPVIRFRLAFFDVVSVVTAFTVAHSITLGLSVMNWVDPPADVIEPDIALSVVLAALNNLLGWFSLKRWRLAFVFGLIHGFGFANVLLDLGLPTQALAVALGGFNVGVELGQLAIVVVFLSVAWWLRHTAFYRWVVVAGGSLAIAIAVVGADMGASGIVRGGHSAHSGHSMHRQQWKSTAIEVFSLNGGSD